MADLMQTYPRKRDGRIERRTWRVDLDAALALTRSKRFDLVRLEAEVREMAEHFPRWVLTASAGREPAPCPSCGGLLVFDRGLRCVECERATRSRALLKSANLAWFGLLPPIGIDGLRKLKRALVAKAPPKHVVGQRPELGHYLLVPLLARYPRDFPASAVQVAYQPGLFGVRGMPPESASHSTHMLGGGFMCLFASGQWRRVMTAREVLQQRAYAHVIKLLNYGAGNRRSFAKVS